MLVRPRLGRLPVLTAALLSVLALGVSACGESEAEKAKAQVCKARTEINKSVESLQSLPLSTSALTTAKTDFESILKELNSIKEAEPKLDSSIKAQVESAQSQFKTEVTKLAGEAIANGASSSNLGATLKSSVTKLVDSYKATINSISCS